MGAGKAAAAADAAQREWRVGDLVLAKVKGFPAWLATVSEPEKWGYPVYCKKVLVYFGTQQMHTPEEVQRHSAPESGSYTISNEHLSNTLELPPLESSSLSDLTHSCHKVYPPTASGCNISTFACSRNSQSSGSVSPVASSRYIKPLSWNHQGLNQEYKVKWAIQMKYAQHSHALSLCWEV